MNNKIIKAFVGLVGIVACASACSEDKDVAQPDIGCTHFPPSFPSSTVVTDQPDPLSLPLQDEPISSLPLLDFESVPSLYVPSYMTDALTSPNIVQILQENPMFFDQLFGCQPLSDTIRVWELMHNCRTGLDLPAANPNVLYNPQDRVFYVEGEEYKLPDASNSSKPGLKSLSDEEIAKRAALENVAYNLSKGPLTEEELKATIVSVYIARGVPLSESGLEFIGFSADFYTNIDSSFRRDEGLTREYYLIDDTPLSDFERGDISAFMSLYGGLETDIILKGKGYNKFTQAAFEATYKELFDSALPDYVDPKMPLTQERKEDLLRYCMKTFLEYNGCFILGNNDENCD